MSVPIWPHSISLLIPMVFHALPGMQWALADAKRLECGSLLPLCLHAQTTCLSPYRRPTGSPQTSATADWNKGQFEGHAAIGAQNPNNVSVPILLPKVSTRFCQHIGQSNRAGSGTVSAP